MPFNFTSKEDAIQQLNAAITASLSCRDADPAVFQQALKDADELAVAVNEYLKSLQQ
jgi:hypothetical protein